MMRVLALYPIEKEIVNDCSIVHVSVPRFISGHFFSFSHPLWTVECGYPKMLWPNFRYENSVQYL